MSKPNTPKGKTKTVATGIEPMFTMSPLMRVFIYNHFIETDKRPGWRYLGYDLLKFAILNPKLVTDYRDGNDLVFYVYDRIQDCIAIFEGVVNGFKNKNVWMPDDATVLRFNLSEELLCFLWGWSNGEMIDLKEDLNTVMELCLTSPMSETMPSDDRKMYFDMVREVKLMWDCMVEVERQYQTKQLTFKTNK